MVDRFLVWVGVILVTAWMSMAGFTGAGLAAADDGAASAAGGDTSSESSNSTGSHQDSTESDTEGPSAGAPREPKGPDADAADTTDDEADEADEVDEQKPAEEPAEVDEQDPAEEPAEDTVEEEPVLADSDKDFDKKDGSDRVDADRASAPVREQRSATVEDDVDVANGPDDALVAEAPADEPAGPTVTEVVEEQSVDLDIPAADLIDAPDVAAVAFAAAPPSAASAVATASPLTALLDVIGTVVFNVYALATRLVGGPPILPAGSNVTVRSSTLRIDCGCADGQGFDVPADWYLPNVEEGQAPPERLIYLQHGFLASGPWYSHTAAALAEQTNSIVVAPSITSNFLDADACWLGAAPMHEALAKLFDAGNTALADSAAAAGYTGPIPTRVVLMGHSLGGGAVSGMAGYMTARGTDGRLAGVVLLDGVGLNGKMADDLDNVPDDIPIYQLGAPKYFWNQFGVGTAALLQARPDAPFIGLTLVGGAHVDTMVGGNPLIQFAQQLVSGFSTPENVAAARQIMVGWVNDMFDPDAPPTGIYEDDLDEPIATPAGDAFAVALPNSLTKPFFLNFLQPFVSLGDGIFTFEPACVAASVGGARGCTTDLIAA